MGQREKLFNAGVEACQRFILGWAATYEQTAQQARKEVKREPGMSYAEAFRHINQLEDRVKLLNRMSEMLDTLKKPC